MRRYILLGLLLGTVAFAQQQFDDERFQLQVQLSRLEKGLPPLRHLEALDALAEDVMVYQIQRSPTSIEHGIVPQDIYFQLLKETYHQIPLSSKWYDLYELLATRWIKGDMEKKLAYAWVGSKIHEIIFYNKRAYWYGYCVRENGDFLYLVMYVTVIYINYPMEELP